MLIPGTNPALHAGGGKQGDLYVLNNSNRGKYVLNNTQIVQEEDITGSELGNNEFRAGPVYWNRSPASGGPLMYHWGGFDTPKAFAFDGSLFSTSPLAMNPYTAILPGGALAVAANGSQAGTSIVWATRFDPTISSGSGVLHAFDASNVANEL